MDEKQMLEKFDDLMDEMVEAKDIRKMKTFANVMRSMFAWMAETRKANAQEYLDRLCSIRWKNYLTADEADLIVSKMNPAAPWKKSEWKNLMEKEAIPTCDKPYYNENALYVEMSKQYSDSANSIATLMGKSVSEVTNAEWARALNMLAVDLLKDADGKYNIRDYFGM